MANTLSNLRRSPAAHLAEAMKAATVTGERGVALEELAFRPQVGIRVRLGTESSLAVASKLGIPLPAQAGEITGDLDGAHIVWLSPDEFLLIDTSREQEPGEADELATVLEGLPGQVLDLSGNRTIFSLTGPSARAVLEKGFHLDLHPRYFPVGTGVASSLGPVQVILYRSGEESYRILPRASFADYMGKWLIDGMREFAQAPVV